MTPSKSKKLYLTRTKLEAAGRSSEHICNEKYFEDFFTAHGFEVVSMEKLKIEEQISLVMGADEIASTIGTLSHWAMFCKPDAKFIMLTRMHRDNVPFQRVVNNIFGNYYIVDVAKHFMYAEQTHSVCLIGANKYWKEFVADYFGEQIEEDDDRDYFEEALNKYVDFWCRKYFDAESANFDKLVNSLKDMCNRITSLEREVTKNRPLLNYQTHVSREGWGAWKDENQLSNSPEQKLDIQAIKIKFTRPFHEIYYSVYFNKKEGWSAEVSAPETAGTISKSKPIRGIKIWLDEAGAKKFDILYRMHRFDGEWTPWAKNGKQLISKGKGKEGKLNSIQIKLEPKPDVLDDEDSFFVRIF